MNRKRTLLLLTTLVSFLIANISWGRTLYYQCDAQGTPVAMTDAQGNIVWQGGCSPFGEDFHGEGTAEPGLGYCGKQYDHQLELYDFGARYYDPAKGRFTGVDPVTGDIADSQRLNSYAYALNNPYKYVDPDGREAIALSILTVVTVGSIVAYESTPGVIQGQIATIRGAAGEIAASARDFSSWVGGNMEIMFAKPGAKAAGNFKVVAEHLANVTGSPMGGFDPDPGKQKKKDEGLIAHWKKEIRTAIENIKKLGLSDKQLMRDLQNKGFNTEQIQQVVTELNKQGIDTTGLPH